MQPLIIVNHRPQTTRAPRRPPSSPAFPTVITPLRDRQQTLTRMNTTGRGLRARTIITPFTQGAKTSITPQHPPRHPTGRPFYLQAPHLRCPALHASQTLLLPVWPPPTPSVEIVHLPTVLLAQICPILPAVFSPQVPRIPQQALSQRQFLDFPSLLIGCSSLPHDNNLVFWLYSTGRARHAESPCRGRLSEPSERYFISIASSVWFVFGLALFC